MIKELTCILCPNGCDLKITCEGRSVENVAGNRCARGEDYAVQELLSPQRNIATSVLVKNGTLPLASVRLTGTIPKDSIFDAVKAIQAVTLTAPVAIGQIVLANVLGLGVDAIATRVVDASCL
ncbi:MAG: DUF1667 domain-containing protein [Oscillospiraceae bacterium]|nr:DUF1667 domain-containing protein [Oscillospiraceae bacterium]